MTKKDYRESFGFLAFTSLWDNLKVAYGATGNMVLSSAKNVVVVLIVSFCFIMWQL